MNFPSSDLYICVSAWKGFVNVFGSVIIGADMGNVMIDTTRDIHAISLSRYIC